MFNLLAGSKMVIVDFIFHSRINFFGGHAHESTGGVEEANMLNETVCKGKILRSFSVPIYRITLQPFDIESTRINPTLLHCS